MRKLKPSTLSNRSFLGYDLERNLQANPNSNYCLSPTLTHCWKENVPEQLQFAPEREARQSPKYPMTIAMCHHPLALHTGIVNQGTPTYTLEPCVPCPALIFCWCSLYFSSSPSRMLLGAHHLLSEPSSRALPSLTSESAPQACLFPPDFFPWLPLQLWHSRKRPEFQGDYCSEAQFSHRWNQNLCTPFSIFKGEQRGSNDRK